LTHTVPTQLYTLSLHDALPIYAREGADLVLAARSIEALTETKGAVESLGRKALVVPTDVRHEESIHTLAEQALSHFGRVDVLVKDRKSTRLNSSHVAISYAVFC